LLVHKHCDYDKYSTDGIEWRVKEFMPTFNRKVRKKINGIEVCVYEVDLSSDKELNKLKAFLINKIKRIKLFNEAESYADLLSPPNLSKKFGQALHERIKEICTPEDHKIKWFDVKRSFVSEFMSQLLLERKYSCFFFEDADKRINVTPDQIDKHASGIDVTGIQYHNSEFKFVVCEVKASGQPKIPCDSSESLLKDIEKAINSKNRVSREILYYLSKLKNIDIDNEFLKEIITFLAELICKSVSTDALINRLVFFPFLIRNNGKIINDSNINDFEGFNKNKFKDMSLNGVIWSFEDNIDDFSRNIYEEALNDL
jgi:hypothetical protein